MRSIRCRRPDRPRILVITTFEFDDYVYDALRAGASGFVLKRAKPDELIDAIRVVSRGESLVFPVLTRRLVERYPKFRLRPLPSGSPFEQPVWADDPEFTLDRHLVDAGQVADDDDLAVVVSRLLSTPLDMHHSPWQFGRHVARARANRG